MSEEPYTPHLFSEELKAATWSSHEAAEDHGFAQDLLAGRLPREGYAALVAQHYFAYLALEEAARALADDPVAGAVVFPELYRVPALERDLAALYGPGWRDAIRPNRATVTYAARIRQMLDWPAGYVAHHYTRYIGDLSGGQFIRRIAVQTYGFAENKGVEFYVFDGLGSLPRFKDSYRRRIDELGLEPGERERVIAETRLAYQLNVEVMAALARESSRDLAA